MSTPGIEDARGDLRAGRQACRLAGLCPGTSGNISARIERRLADDADQFLAWVNLEPGQLSQARPLPATHVAGDPPTKEALPAPLRSTTCGPRTAPSCIATPTHAVAISCLDPSCHHNKETTLPPITPYFVMRVGKLRGVPTSSRATPSSPTPIRGLRQGAIAPCFWPITAQWSPGTSLWPPRPRSRSWKRPPSSICCCKDSRCACCRIRRCAKSKKRFRRDSETPPHPRCHPERSEGPSATSKDPRFARGDSFSWN